MKDKPFWQSKTVYAAIAVVLITVLQEVGVPLQYVEVLYSMAGALGLYGLRSAVGNLKK